jgi:hypothetical protein
MSIGARASVLIRSNPPGAVTAALLGGHRRELDKRGQKE